LGALHNAAIVNHVRGDLPSRWNNSFHAGDGGDAALARQSQQPVSTHFQEEPGRLSQTFPKSRQRPLGS
jgi:hypothetical protein